MIREAAIDFILRPDIEGGYANNPDDPGGETNFGISKRAHPSLDIRNLTKAQAAKIYADEYWAPTAGRVADFAPRLAFIMLDCAVNQGKGFASMALQEIVHASQDGIIGPATLAALHDTLDARGEAWVVAEYVSRRCTRYAANKNVSKFGHHWFYRVPACLLASEQSVSAARSTVLPELLDQILGLVKQARSEVA
jgi:lysozyme family protein